MSYAYLIVNPIAGAGKTIKKWPYIKDLLRSLNLDFEYSLTEAPCQAIQLAKSAVQKGCEMVIAVGGDGTINEVVNGLYEADCLNKVKLGIISTGTGADYVRTLNIPRDFEAACQRFINPKTKLVDLGIVECISKGIRNRRLFVNFAGLGFDAEIVKATTQTFKAFGDTPSYLMGLLATLLFYQSKNVSIIADGHAEQMKVCTVLMSNGKYAGGGMLTTPDADPNDGFFDVLIVGNMAKLDLLRSLPRIYKGTHLSHPKVIIKRIREIEIQPELKMCVQADGDLIGEAPGRFSVLPSALNVII